MLSESNVILTQTKSRFCSLCLIKQQLGHFVTHTQAIIKRVQKQIPQLKMVHENNTIKKKGFREQNVFVLKNI